MNKYAHKTCPEFDDVDAILAWHRNEIDCLTQKLQERDKCSFIGPMRDCPTHGESKDAARYRWLKRQPWVKTKWIHAWGALLDDAIDEARHDAPDETPNVKCGSLMTDCFPA